MKKLTTLAVSAAIACGIQAAPAAAQNLYIGQIIMGGWNFCPRSTTPANGQLIAINSNQALFSLYGTTYGGDGRTTFGLPDLRGRIAMHSGSGPGLTPVPLGQKSGRERFTQTVNEMASHSHTITNTVTATGNVAGGPATATTGEGNALSNNAAGTYTSQGAPNKALKNGSVAVGVTSTALNAGGSQSTNIRNPYQGIQFCVVEFGVFPSRN